MVLKARLQGIPCELVSCSDGESALVELKQAQRNGNPYQVVLIDLNMPGMDGFMVCRAIADDPSLKLCYRIILSSSQEPEDVQRAFHECGAQAFILKPFPKELVQVLNSFRFPSP